MLQSYMDFDRKLPKYNLFKIFCVSLPQTVTIQRFVHLTYIIHRDYYSHEYSRIGHECLKNIVCE